MHGDFECGAGIVVDRNVFERGDEIDLLQRLVMIFHVLVRLGGAFMIVEGYTG